MVDASKRGLEPGLYPGTAGDTAVSLINGLIAALSGGGVPVGDLSKGLPPALDPFIPPNAPGGGIDAPPEFVPDPTQGGGGDFGGGGDGFSQGGFVNTGDPQSRTDDVPAMLQHGEYVVPRPAMQRLAEKTGGYQQAAQKVKEMIIRFANDGKGSVHFKERG
jgi:hypothetical protein